MIAARATSHGTRSLTRAEPAVFEVDEPAARSNCTSFRPISNSPAVMKPHTNVSKIVIVSSRGAAFDTRSRAIRSVFNRRLTPVTSMCDPAPSPAISTKTPDLSLSLSFSLH